MTDLLLIGLALFFVGCLLVYWRGSREGVDPAPRSARYRDGVAAENIGTALQRLFSKRDRLFLQLQPGYRPQLERRLRRNRKRAMALFLDQHFAEFRQLMSAAAEVARTADPEFGADLARLSLRFHSLYAAAWLQLRLFGAVLVPVPQLRIATLVQGLRADVTEKHRQISTSVLAS